MSDNTDNIVFSTLKKMFNNPDYSDMVFVVNNVEYQAFRAFVAATTDVFEALLLKGFQEANQKKIVIPDVKNQESFYHILRYIYGMKIDFSTLSVELLCEMIGMAEYYHLPSLFTSIQTYLETIETCDHKSLGVVVNKAKLYKLDALYSTWKNYVLENVSSLITSNDLTNISYDVLFDLMKSSRVMEITEITKLKFILDWFNNNEVQTFSTNEEILIDVDKNNLEKEIENFVLNVEIVDINNLEKEKDNFNLNFEIVDKNNLEKETDKFILMIIKNINFDKIICADLVRLFKAHDEYTQYEKIVNDFLINNFDGDIEELEKNKIQLYKEQTLNEVFGTLEFSFTMKIFKRKWRIETFLKGSSWNVEVDEYSKIIIRNMDETFCSGKVAIFEDHPSLNLLEFKNFCFVYESLMYIDCTVYTIPATLDHYKNLRVNIYFH